MIAPTNSAPQPARTPITYERLHVPLQIDTIRPASTASTNQPSNSGIFRFGPPEWPPSSLFNGNISTGKRSLGHVSEWGRKWQRRFPAGGSLTSVYWIRFNYVLPPNRANRNVKPTNTPLARLVYERKWRGCFRPGQKSYFLRP